MQPLRPRAKCGVVFAGVAIALVAAWSAIAIRQRFASGPAEQASSGMQAFGDLLLGGGVFCLVGVVPLVLALNWLRPVARFWRALAVVALAVAATGPLLLALTFVLPPAAAWTIAVPLRVIVMPALGALWFTSGTFAPEQRERWLLWGAALIEVTGFVTTVLVKVVLPLAR